MSAATKVDGLAARGNEARKAIAAERGDSDVYDVAVRLAGEYLSFLAACADVAGALKTPRLPTMCEDALKPARIPSITEE